ncbi:MAG: D-aminoacyl-tRNA deacylase [Opitutaceae bacterium]
MRAVLQRVSRASVLIDGRVTREIGRGYLVLLGVHQDDTPADAEWICGRIPKLRLFDDAKGQMNLSLLDVGGGLLIVSQFTLFGTTKKGTRPSYHEAARPEVAIPLYEKVVALLSTTTPGPVATGEFGAGMQVELVNDGPVTLLLDSRRRD